MLRSNYILLIFAILIVSICFDLYTSHKNIICEGEDGRVFGYLYSNGRFLIGNIDDKSSKCISQKWGLFTSEIKTIFVIGTQRLPEYDKCSNSKSSRQILSLTKIWKDICTSNIVNLDKMAYSEISLLSDRLEIRKNKKSSEIISTIVFFTNTFRKKRIEVYESKFTKIDTNN